MASALTVPPLNTSGLDEFTRSSVGPERRCLSIVCVGAHPDDPESGCGGTLARLAADGHRVSIVYLTRGEAGIKDGNIERTAQVRSEEALKGAGLLGAEAYFASQIDGETTTEKEAVQEFTRLLASLKPDIVFTHWPLDTHRDHRNAAQLTYEAWESLGESFALVYYEVMTGIQPIILSRTASWIFPLRRNRNDLPSTRTCARIRTVFILTMPGWKESELQKHSSRKPKHL